MLAVAYKLRMYVWVSSDGNRNGLKLQVALMITNLVLVRTLLMIRDQSLRICIVFFLFPLSVFRFNDEKRGRIEFSGNVLFTHFNEIGDPAPTDLDNDSFAMEPVAREYSVNKP